MILVAKALGGRGVVDCHLTLFAAPLAVFLTVPFFRAAVTVFLTPPTLITGCQPPAGAHEKYAPVRNMLDDCAPVLLLVWEGSLSNSIILSINSKSP